MIKMYIFLNKITMNSIFEHYSLQKQIKTIKFERFNHSSLIHRKYTFSSQIKQIMTFVSFRSAKLKM